MVISETGKYQWGYLFEIATATCDPSADLAETTEKEKKNNNTWVYKYNLPIYIYNGLYVYEIKLIRISRYLNFNAGTPNMLVHYYPLIQTSDT